MNKRILVNDLVQLVYDDKAMGIVLKVEYDCGTALHHEGRLDVATVYWYDIKEIHPVDMEILKTIGRPTNNTGETK